MGGRSVFAGGNNSQISMKRYLEYIDIQNIKREYEQTRAIQNTLLNFEQYSCSKFNTKRKRCACCEQYTLPANSVYEICENCGWVDDPSQNQNMDLINGANPMSLRQARALWWEL